MLSTCNRAEIYAVGDTDATAEGVGRFFSEFHELPHADVAPHICTFAAVADAARHLFRVAAGLDSLVVGEPQILGQVKAAYATASDAQFTGALTNRLFHSAFAVGKRVRTETGLGEGAVSVSYAAIALARKIFGDLKGRSVLILGAGEMAQAHRRRTCRRRTSGRSRSPAARWRSRARRWPRSCGGRAVAVGGARRRRSARSRHRHHRHRRGGAGPDARAHRRGRCGRGAAGRCSSSTSRCRATSKPARRRPRSGVSLQHRRPSDDRAGEPRAPRRRGCARAESIVDEEVARFSVVAAVARKSSRPSSRCGSGSRRSGRPSCTARAQARGTAARSARARRRNHAPDRRKAAADADRAAQVASATKPTASAPMRTR